MSTIQQYNNYFENLAKKHKDILHSDDNKRFYRQDIEEFLLGDITDFDHTSMILSEYDYGFGDNGADYITKRPLGTFAILTRIGDTNDFEAIEAAYQKAESIVDDIIAKMYEDADRDTEYADILDGFDLNDVEAIRLSNYVNAYGVMVRFRISTHHNISVNTDKWEE